jgi:long-chain acyl-CoA synthetase
MSELAANTVRFETIPERFFLSASRFKDKTAIMYKEDKQWKNLSYDELTEKVIDLTVGLIGIGMAKGDRAAILSENRLEYYISELAIGACGAATVPIYTNSSLEQAEYILKNSCAKFLFASDDESIQKKLSRIKLSILENLTIVGLTLKKDDRFKQSIGELISRASGMPAKDEFFRRLRTVSSDDLATIIYTSGTSGNPKGVMLTHENIVSNAVSAVGILPIDRHSLNISLLPLSHALEKTCSFFIFLFQGATIAILDNLNNLSKTLKEIAPTHLIGVPKLFEAIYNQIFKEINKKGAIKRKVYDIGIKSAVEVFNAKLSKKQPRLTKRILTNTINQIAFNKIREALGGRLKLLISGGAPLPVYLSEFFNAIGIPIIEGYGLTEAAPVVSCNNPEYNRPGSVGVPVSGVAVRIGADGEIMVKGPNVMKGYYNDHDATSEVIDTEGWLHTGDIGSIDEAGFITITGRKKELIVTNGGKKIFPHNIESRLLSNPFIKQAVVLGEGRDYLCALIVPDRDNLEAKGYPKNDLSSFEAMVADEISKINSSLSNYEKIRKFKILDRDFSIESGELTPTFKLRRSFIIEKYRDILREIYGS